MNETQFVIKMSMICGNCGAKCQSVHTVGWSDSAVCEKCQLGSMYKFVKFVQNNHLPYWQRRIIAVVTGCFPFFWGFNTCSHCGLTPPFGRYSVDYGNEGSELLCVSCFEELPLDVNLAYHRAHWQRGKNECGPHVTDRELYQYTGWTEDDWDERWNRIEEAVIREHRLIPFRNSLEGQKES